MIEAKHFISAVTKHSGIAKSNKYSVGDWKFPSDIKDKINGLIERQKRVSPKGETLKNWENDIKYFCESANIPGRNFATQSFRTGAISKEYIHANNFAENFALTFTLTDNMFIKYFFDTWQDTIIGLVEKKDSSNIKMRPNIQKFPNEYCGDFTITQLTGKLEDGYKIKIIQAFPKQVNPINLGFSSQDPMRLTVTMAYSRWEYGN